MVWGRRPRPQQQVITGPDGCYERFYQQLAAAITDGADNPVPASEALAVIELIEAARTSHQQGRRVALD